MSLSNRKKILVPIFYRAHLGRLRSVLHAIERHPQLELQVMSASQAAFGSFFANIIHSEPRSWRFSLPWYIKAIFLGGRDPLLQKIREEGFSVHSQISLFLDGGTPTVMAKSVGLGIIKIIDEMRRLKPDIVFINADRFEMMALTIAAAYLNIPIAHNEAGDISGTIDESVRHAITKFAHMHFTATETSRKRVIQMGEDPCFVFTVGSPVIDILKKIDQTIPEIPGFDIKKPFLLAMLHPVTTQSEEENLRIVNETISVLEKLKMPTILIGGNSDAHSRAVGPSIASWADNSNHSWLFWAKWLHPDRYFRALANAACALGNSSSFIREAAYLGTPAVLVGSRQQGRERGKNVMEIAVDADKIEKAVRDQLAHGRYPQDLIFGDGNAGEKIAEILATINPSIQKKFYER